MNRNIPTVRGLRVLCGCAVACAALTATPRLAAGAAAIDDMPPAKADPNDWPWWRGPNKDNIAPADQDPPVKWSETTNVLWRVKLRGLGYGTPCVAGKRVVLAEGDTRRRTISVICLDRGTGKPLWETTVYRGKLPKIHKDNSHASPTVACDGERLFFPYQTADSIKLAALDLEGKIVWNKTIGPYESVQGYSASAALHKSAVIVPLDIKGPSKLAALHRRTGEVVWEAKRSGINETYASPLVASVGGRDQVFIIGPGNTSSYDADTGKPLWECKGPAQFCAAVVAFDGERVYSTGGWPERSLLAIRANGAGDVTGTHVAWEGDKKVGYVPSPLLHDGLLYAVSDKSGLLRCYDAPTGKIVWSKDLDAPFYSSPVWAAGRIYLFDRKGKGYVFKAGRKLEPIAENTLPAGAFATPVILDGKIYIRTMTDIYCLGTGTKP